MPLRRLHVHAPCRAVAVLALALTGGGGGAAEADHAQELQRLVANCNVSMASNVCSVSSGPSAPAGTSAPVFVVGAGPVDAAAYRSLQESGRDMCPRARAACTADWSGTVCRTARSLWDN